ncbi:MAG: O-antigen ligase family protein, partial [Nevskia sp.]|nr:O-antigen ligase family protein [Nevskia sp.]
AVAGLLAAVVGLSVASGSSVARVLFMLSAMLLAGWAKRRSPWLYLCATLWIWLSAAFVRRMIEWHPGFNPLDIVLITPNLTVMLIVPDLLNTRGLLTRRGVGYALVLFACALYGMLVSFVNGSIVGGAIAAADWLVPLLYLFLFICHADRIDEAEAHLTRFLTYSLLFVVPYALYQYFYMPDWDAQWLLASGLSTFGHALPMESHVFGPLNQPGFLAVWVGVCILWIVYFRSRLLLLAVPFLLLLLAATQVRSVAGSVALAIGVGALIGRGGFGRLAMIAVVAGISGYVGLSVLDSRVTDQIVARFGTVQKLSDDNSAQTRQQIYAETPRLIDENPFGTGIGAQGRGNAEQSVEGGHKKDVNTVNVDSGPLSVFLALGWVAGPVYILTMLLLQYRALLVGRRFKSPTAAAMATAALVPLGIFPFLNILGFNASVLWICLGYPLAVEIHATNL